ncbi:general transcription factor II-I repeat domain-containing protein 2-like [Macrobrachium rosenbergii]|uniref:general transcription factor II-I repeat domain-containing protein 2-like n=1 Tax=Macrobrachium rosenbergii TaxID=79674 RepID=UPI0034D73C96
MSLSKRRKVDTESRVFQEKWTQYYLFTEVNTKPVCLVCNQQVSVLKEYNIRRHYETRHEEKYHHLQGELRIEKINELLTGLKKPQSAFTRSREVSDAAVKASYLIANELVQASKPFSDGEFVKTCMLKAAEIVCPEKRPAFANISLSRNTVADRVEDLSGDLGRQMNDKIKSFIAFSVAIDESTDVTDVAQLAIFIRGVDETLTITEEFLELVPMKDTTTAMTSSALSLECWTRPEWTGPGAYKAIKSNIGCDGLCADETSVKATHKAINFNMSDGEDICVDESLVSSLSL